MLLLTSQPLRFCMRFSLLQTGVSRSFHARKYGGWYDNAKQGFSVRYFNTLPFGMLCIDIFNATRVISIEALFNTFILLHPV